MPQNKQSFAPLDTPLHRRLQTLSVFWHTICIPFFISFALFLVAIVPFSWILAIPSLIYYMNDQSFKNGSVVNRRSQRIRSLKLWKYYCDYFPIKIVKTHEIEPSLKTITVQNDFWIKARLLGYNLKVWRRRPYDKLVPTGKQYIFGYHPHGVVAMGAMGAFATEGTNFSAKFPNISVSLLTLGTQFLFPIYREYLMSLGISSVHKENIEAILKQHESVCIVIGGASESLLAKPGARKLILKNRKGFIKIALRSKGTSVVPVFAFGENEIYEITRAPDNSWLHKFQLILKRRLGFTLPLFHARGIFNYNFGLLPHRQQITLVFGEPLNLPDIETPTNEEVEKYHAEYVNKLLKVYNDYKHKYGYTDDLEIL